MKHAQHFCAIILSQQKVQDVEHLLVQSFAEDLEVTLGRLGQLVFAGAGLIFVRCSNEEPLDLCDVHPCRLRGCCVLVCIRRRLWCSTGLCVFRLLPFGG